MTMREIGELAVSARKGSAAATRELWRTFDVGAYATAEPVLCHTCNTLATVATLVPGYYVQTTCATHAEAIGRTMRIEGPSHAGQWVAFVTGKRAYGISNETFGSAYRDRGDAFMAALSYAHPLYPEEYREEMQYTRGYVHAANDYGARTIDISDYVARIRVVQL